MKLCKKAGLFVHMPRTGGTFLREYFKKASKNIIQFGHWRLSEGNIHQCYIRQQLPIPENLLSLDNYFKFIFIRNPWDWYVSRYFYFCRCTAVENGLSIRCDSGLQDTAFLKKFPTFKNHMIWGRSHDSNFWLNYRYKEMCFVNNKNLIDYTGKFENIEEALNNIFKQCNIVPEISYQDFYLNIKKRNKNIILNSTIHDHYSYYYDKELIDLVYKKDNEIIDEFNYAYEDESK